VFSRCYDSELCPHAIAVAGGKERIAGQWGWDGAAASPHA
jgi:hypothetical protein